MKHLYQSNGTTVFMRRNPTPSRLRPLIRGLFVCTAAVICALAAWAGTDAVSEKNTPETFDTPKEGFYVYFDADYRGNHFTPSGYMGDCGDIEINESCTENPHSNRTCIRVVYAAKGKGPNVCDYSAPCKWAGVYWQYPPNNWGKDSVHKDAGFDLSAHKKLVFWARAEKECRIEFKVGGIAEQFGDSLKSPRTNRAKLTTSWQEFEIDLDGADLSHIIGGFCWATDWQTNPDGVTFYLDDIRYE